MNRNAIKTKSLFDPDERLYLSRAKQALPILVRQAHACQTIYYEDLAKELNMPYELNLNYVLGAIGSSLQKLTLIWDKTIPPLQCIVINKSDGLPGAGFTGFLQDRDLYSRSPKRVKKQILKTILGEVFIYPYWEDVLQHFELQMPSVRAIDIAFGSNDNGDGWGGGESVEHVLFKDWIFRNPKSVNIKNKITKSCKEHLCDSLDKIDVVFETGKEIIAVEVKSRISGELDIRRGLFQCVKYGALLEANQIVSGQRKQVKVILAVEGRFPNSLIVQKNQLGIEVIDNLYQLIES